jgi:hypothetical protein
MATYLTMGLEHIFPLMLINTWWVVKLELMALALEYWVVDIQLPPIIGVELGT